MLVKAAAVFDDSTAASATKRLEAVAMACNDSAIRWRRSLVVDVFVRFCGGKIGDMVARDLCSNTFYGALFRTNSYNLYTV